MAGWIKIEKDLESDPRVLRMAKAIDRMFWIFPSGAEIDPCNACAFPGVTLVCGALTRLWVYADSHIRDDNTLDLGAAEIDEWLGIPNFCSLMPSDWLVEIDDATVELPGFQEHNGVEAKKRALTQKRVSIHRSNAKRTSVSGSNASALPDQDQTKTRPRPEEKKISSASPPREAVEEVFRHWQTEWDHPDAKLDQKRGGRIAARLKDFSVAQLCQAISGFKNSPWHCGTDPKGGGKVYDGLQTLLRDTAQVEEGIRLFKFPPKPPPNVVALSPVERVLAAARKANGDERVVSEQGGGGLGGAVGDLRQSVPARVRGISAVAVGIRDWDAEGLRDHEGAAAPD